MLLPACRRGLRWGVRRRASAASACASAPAVRGCGKRAGSGGTGRRQGAGGGACFLARGRLPLPPRPRGAHRAARAARAAEEAVGGELGSEEAAGVDVVHTPGCKCSSEEAVMAAGTEAVAGTGEQAVRDIKEAPSSDKAVVDAEEALERLRDARYAALLASGEWTAADVERARAREATEEELEVCDALAATKAWRFDATVSRTRVALCRAAALEALQRRSEAVACLKAFLAADGSAAAAASIGGEPAGGRMAVALSLAKLCFKAGDKREALVMLESVIASFVGSDKGDGSGKSECCAEDGEEAYHLAGWVSVHADDHSGAYEVWLRGAAACGAACAPLQRQAAKRVCWDTPLREDAAAAAAYVGGAPAEVAVDALEAFAVPPSRRRSTPALALFDDGTQRRRLVWRCTRPLLSAQECAHVCAAVEAHVRDELGGTWGTVRRASVRTTDCAVEDVRCLRPWLRELMRTRICPMLAAAFPRLADGSTLGERGERVRIHDAFIVRYACDDGSLSLPEHSDTSLLSVTLALNSACADFEGGGTWFEALGEAGSNEGRVVDAAVGHAVAFAGPLRHAGFPVTRGTRIILVLFLYAEGFSYGDLLADYQMSHGYNAARSLARAPDAAECAGGGEDCQKTRPSGDAEGGFVVYRQTTALVEMLNRRAVSVLDD